MKSAVITPPNLKENNKNRVLIPSMIFVIQEGNEELLKYVECLENRIKHYISKAQEKGNARRVAQLNYYLEKVFLLKVICNSDVKKSNGFTEASKAFNSMMDRANLQFAQFRVEGNVQRVIETDYILDDLKVIHFEAAKFGIKL